ncbi:transposase [Streptosporangium amethystogenes subsp. fukuiense]|uniref:Transposase n=1 Tax=Streptosporangium amethystogenes subsp. fukuiense TaxID=698418 RepID=A0ABW2SX23_9ACTN
MGSESRCRRRGLNRRTHRRRGAARSVVYGREADVMVIVTPADTPDRDCARELLFRLRLTHPEITLVWADSAYAGSLIEWARTFLDLTVKVVSRPRGAQGFVVLAKRWVVERSLSWVLRARRNIRDHERLPQHSEIMITWSAIIQMTRRLTRSSRARTSWGRVS